MENNNTVLNKENSIKSLIGPIDIIIFVMFFILAMCFCRGLYKKAKDNERKDITLVHNL